MNQPPSPSGPHDSPTTSGVGPPRERWPLAAPEGSCPPRLARYRIAGSLGRGGFADVFLAHDEELDRQVALKVPRRDRFRNEEELRAFVDEARMAARLQHPGIVNVFDVGHHEGIPFIVLEYIRGRTLAHFIQHESVTWTLAAQMVAAVAEALWHAHDHGFVHRDIKPQNILLDTDDRPHIADFGLAIRHRDLVGMTDELAGTTQYMSPEQVRGENHRIDGRTDIWALGVVFYRMLTGRMPFQGSSAREVHQQILYTDPLPPRQVDPNVPTELERICLRCLCRQMSERYRRAADLADDLSEWLRFTTSGSGSSVRRRAEPIERHDAPVIPRGLRSYDGEDVDFFARLIPGPRDRDGLPSVIRFWKNRIEERDAEETFKIGLLYGPSGCGKSSLVKAGLLPRIHPDVVPLYIDASSRETETRAGRALRKQFPRLPREVRLDDAVRLLREQPDLRGGQKVLLVLDQFEQWLQTWRDDPNAEMVRALRHCDGGNVQCLLLARDDFWLPVARFMRSVEVTIVEYVNGMLVDSFDLEHARRVLREFGVAYGRLPANPSEQTAAQTRFLEQATQELAQENRLYPVRLAIFVEMVKDRPWTPETLEEMGGTEGVGVAYLETSVGSLASSARRIHEPAARRVLAALLPPSGQIKDSARSRSELLAISGYSPQEFDQLMHLLDGELRLLTPAPSLGDDSGDASRDGQDASQESGATHEMVYQLTHDYLVPSIRQWIERQMRETRRGRTLLRLQEQSELWNSRPAPRFLPSFTEWVGIRLRTRRSEWTGPQRRMMQAANRRLALRTLMVAAAGLAVVSLGLAVYDTFSQRWDRNIAEQLVSKLYDVAISDVPQVIAQITPYRTWVVANLRDTVADRTQPERRRVRAALALLPQEPSHAEWLIDRLISEQTAPQDFPVLCDALRTHAPAVLHRLRVALTADAEAPQIRIRVACALATMEPTAGELARLETEIANALVREPAAYAMIWIDALRPAAGQLRGPLVEVLRGPLTLEAARIGALALFEFDGERTDQLVDLLPEARAPAYRAIVELLRRSPGDALRRLHERFQTLQGSPSSDEASDRLAQSQVNVMLACFELGDMSLLAQGARVTTDPRVRTALVHSMNRERLDVATLLPLIFAPQRDPALQNVAMLAMWEHLDEPLNQVLRQRLTDHVLHTYRTAPDPESHAAAGLLLRKLGLELADIDRQLASPGPAASRRWYIHPAGLTMVVLTPSSAVMKGFPTPIDLKHAFAISATEVTIAQLRKGVPRFPQDASLQADEENAPAVGVLTLVAARYCNWLSRQEGLPPEEWCYPEDRQLTETGGMPAPGFLNRSGYRLPLSSEWEFACRAGSLTDYSFGNDPGLMRYYGWDKILGNFQVRPVANLLPNAHGLFDMYGNASEICIADPAGQRLVSRGQSVSGTAAGMKSHLEIEYDPRSLRTFQGFRVVRLVKD